MDPWESILLPLVLRIFFLPLLHAWKLCIGWKCDCQYKMCDKVFYRYIDVLWIKWACQTEFPLNKHLLERILSMPKTMSSTWMLLHSLTTIEMLESQSVCATMLEYAVIIDVCKTTPEAHSSVYAYYEFFIQVFYLFCLTGRMIGCASILCLRTHWNLTICGSYFLLKPFYAKLLDRFNKAEWWVANKQNEE